jgi:TPR repeat protein
MRSSLLLVVLAAGCQQCRGTSSTPDAGPTLVEDAGQTVVRAAPPAPRSCVSYDACLSACDAGTASGCYDATLFLLEMRDGRNLSAIPPLTALACERGDGRGCVRAERFEDATRLLPGQCDAGSAEACELWFTSAQRLDAGVALEASRRAHSLLETACDEKQAWACARLGSMLARGRLGVTDVKKGVRLLEASCEAGVAGACLEATLIFTRGLPDFEPDPARAAKTASRARELSRLVP